MRTFKIKRGGQTYFAVDLPPDPTGKRQRITRKSAKEAKDAALAALRQPNNAPSLIPNPTPTSTPPPAPQSDSPTLRAFLSEYLEHIRPSTGAAPVSPRTWQDYRYLIEKNISAQAISHGRILGDLRLSELTTRVIDDWLQALRTRGLERSVIYSQSVLRRALQFAVEWGYISQNPASQKNRTAKHVDRHSLSRRRLRMFALTPEQAGRLLNETQHHWQNVFYAMALTTGLRPEEMYGLKWADLDLPACRMRVQRAVARTRPRKGEEGPRWSFAPTKSSGGQRTLDYPIFLKPLLEQQRHKNEEMRLLAGDDWQEHDLVFPSHKGTPLDERNNLSRFHALLASIGLPKVRLYDLRHTHASLLIAEGKHPKLIAERLGHSSIKLTMDTYGHLFPGADQSSAHAMDQLFASAYRKARVPLEIVPLATDVLSARSAGKKSSSLTKLLTKRAM